MNFIYKYFRFFKAIVSSVVFFFLNFCFRLFIATVYKYNRLLCVALLYNMTLLNSGIISGSFFVGSWRFST